MKIQLCSLLTIEIEEEARYLVIKKIICWHFSHINFTFWVNSKSWAIWARDMWWRRNFPVKYFCYELSAFSSMFIIEFKNLQQCRHMFNKLFIFTIFFYIILKHLIIYYLLILFVANPRSYFHNLQIIDHNNSDTGIVHYLFDCILHLCSLSLPICGIDK